MIHPLGLAYFQDLCVAQVLQATLKLVQGIRLESQRSHDLLPHHLHYLQNRETEEGGVKSSRIQDADSKGYRDKVTPLILVASEEHINFCSPPDGINYFFFQNQSL